MHLFNILLVVIVFEISNVFSNNVTSSNSVKISNSEVDENKRFIEKKIFTETQLKAIQKLRILMKDELYREFMKKNSFLLLWVEDQKYDIERAAEKLRKSINWRKKNKIDDILKEDLRYIFKICPFQIGEAHDREFRPVFFGRLGSCQARKFLLTHTGEELDRGIAQVLESSADLVRKISLEPGKENVTRAMGLLDFNGFNIVQQGCLRCIQSFVSLFTIYNDNYPNYLNRVIFFNVPRVASGLIQILIPLLPDYLRNSLKIYGFDKSEWRPELIKIIEPQELVKIFNYTKY